MADDEKPAAKEPAKAAKVGRSVKNLIESPLLICGVEIPSGESREVPKYKDCAALKRWIDKKVISVS